MNQSQQDNQVPEEPPAQKATPKKGGKGPVLRFGLLFVLLVSAFHVVFYAWFSKSPAFEYYLELNARLSGMIANLLGSAVTVDGSTITSVDFAVEVRRGCDAIQPAAIFLSGVLSFPANMKARLIGALTGTIFIFCINIVRIVSLFYIGVHYPDLFELMHVEVWQVGFIFLALLLWIVWLRWALPPVQTEAT